jgi:D-alanyl-D-alanine carboxypeptidase (penicillin-binding protein 5/6)
VTTTEVGLARAGERVGSVVFTAGTQKISVPLALEKAIDDPGALWRLSNPFGLLD